MVCINLRNRHAWFWVFLALFLLQTLPSRADEKTDGSPSAIKVEGIAKRLTQQQYRNVIADIFGLSVKVGGPFEPDIRDEGLHAIGASKVSVTASGLEGYDKIARSIADQALSDPIRATIMPCVPASQTAADNACASAFLSKVGRLLYRRPLTPKELEVRVQLAATLAQSEKNFYAGLATSLYTLLIAPEFLFIRENTIPDANGSRVLDSASKASRLSFFLWNSSPDLYLLTAAENGGLNSKAGLAKQVDRMLASSRVRSGLRASFSDLLALETLDTLAKDHILFPKYNPQIAREAREQTLMTIEDLLLDRNGDYRDLFTTRITFLTPLLASIYAVAAPRSEEAWMSYEFPAGDPRAGILSHVSFVAMHAHPGRSSPTLRGKALRELLLCQKVPLPPGNVNFLAVQDVSSPVLKTARKRLAAHATEAMCTGCHKIVDPIGLAFETFDASGSYRTSENGETIDTSGALDGVTFSDTAGLARAVRDSPATSSCIVDRMYAYGLGRALTKRETEWLDTEIKPAFVTADYRIRPLLRRIAVDEAFFRVGQPAEVGERVGDR